MTDLPSFWHPDLYGLSNGMRYYARRQFHAALEDFKYGAHYADKLSQLSIGLMYLNGEGVAKDPVQAVAWLDPAAERNYPEFVATRDRVKSSLSADQLARAQALRAELEPQYGDAAAKYRMSVQLRLGTMYAFTGSLAGFDAIGTIVQKPPCRGQHTSAAGSGAQAPADCDDGILWPSQLWNPKTYFAQRDRAWRGYRGKVTVGPRTEAGNDAPAGQADDAGRAEEPQPAH